MNIAEQLQQDVDRVIRSHHAAVEKACEIALTGGACGVAVYDDATVVDPDVPYGQIHYFPGRAAP